MTTAVKFIDLKCNIELICNKHQHAQIFKQPNDTTEAIDSHGTIAFSVEYMKSHMLSNKQYAVTLKCKEKTEYCKCDKNHSRVVSFLSLDKSSYPARKGNAAYLLPTLYFNLTNNSTCPNISVGSIDTSSFVLQYREKRTDDISTYPEHNEVDLQIVYSPHYTPTKECNTSLMNYFSVKRSVKIGDIIALDTSDDLKNRQALSPMLSQRYPVVYYVVSKINGKLEAGGETYLLQVNNIDLAQDSGAYNTPIPSLIYHTYHSPFPSLVPGLAGLDVYKQRLIDVVRPFVVQRTLNELILLSGPTGCGKSSIVQAVAAYFNMHFVTERCQQLIKDKPKLTEDKIEGVFSRAKFCGPLILLLKNFEVLAKSLDGTADDARVAEFVKSSLNNLLKLDDSRHPVIVIATSTAPQKINKDLYSTCIYNIAIESPSENEREVIIRDLLQSVKHAASTDVAYITQRTAGFYLGDLQTLFVHAQGKANRRADYKNCINQSDVQKALDQMQESHSDAIGAPKIPNVKWDDIGGLEDVKKAIKDTVQLPLEHPELFAAGLKRSGVVLFGPPGTGKTMMAKAVATECSLNFMSVKGPELINMYVGQSEENIRQVFERARSAAPCIIFFDELDSLAPNRGNSGDSGGVMDRIVSQLLAELDGMNKSTDVFVIGATNRLELVDPALLRPGRFDKHLYLGLSTKLDQKVSIIKALTKKFELAQDCDITEIAKTCKMNMTGADYYALCVDALMLSIEKKIKRLERGEREDQSKIVVTRKDFTEANDKLIPSLTAADIETYEKSAANFAAK